MHENPVHGGIGLNSLSIHTGLYVLSPYIDPTLQSLWATPLKCYMEVQYLQLKREEPGLLYTWRQSGHLALQLAVFGPSCANTEAAVQAQLLQNICPHPSAMGSNIVS